LSPSRPPRLVFVGVIRSFAPVSTHKCRSEPLAQVISSRAKDTDRGRAGDRLLGFSSRLRSAPPWRSRALPRASPQRCDPALGFVPLSGFADTVRTCNRVGSSPRGSPTSGQFRRTHTLAADRPIRSWASNASSPILRANGTSAGRGIKCDPASSRRSPRPALQRFRGADALPHAPGLRARVERLPV